jgi:nicotinamide-nucleotide amidase
MARAALVLVGSELVSFSRPDTNGPYAKERLASIGIPLVFSARVTDAVEEIRLALEAAHRCAEIVITSGGLGPTGDDLTREGAAALVGRGLTEDAPWLAVLEKRLSERGRALTQIGRKQAAIVEGGRAIANPIGLACGCWLEVDGCDLILLPGVPSEFRAMLDKEILPKLQKRYRDRPEVRVIKALAAGLPEADAEEVLKPWYKEQGVEVSILPQRGVHRITFTITAPPAEDPARLEASARDALAAGLGGHLVSLDGTSLEEALGARLLERGWSLAVAESCTGGLLGHKVVSVPGASRYFLGGIVAYDNAAKRDLLGVPSGILEKHGAVSEETALAMARGARARFNAHCALATTGVAGPAGGSPEKPVGTVWIAAATPEAEVAQRICFPVDRESVMEIGANYAMYLLWGMTFGRS